MKVGVAILMLIGDVSMLRIFGAPLPVIAIDPVNQVSRTPVEGQYFGFDETHSDAMIGYTFYLHQAITVSQIGWFDSEQDGLSRPFRVGLWKDLSGATSWPFIDPRNSVQLLGNSATGITIPGGTLAPLNGVWRVVNLATPLTLQPGGYELAGLDSATRSDAIRYVLGGPSNPYLTIGAPVQSYSAETEGFHASDSFIAVSGLELGPMLFSNIPEPSSWGLLICGAGTLFLFRLMQRQRSALAVHRS
jgi:hypothetical protein